MKEMKIIKLISSKVHRRSLSSSSSSSLIPWSKGLESSAKREFGEKIDNQVVDIYGGRDSLYPLPHVLTGYQVESLRKLQEAIYFTLSAIITNFSRDSRIYETYGFEPKIRSLLSLYDSSSIPYRNVGSYR